MAKLTYRSMLDAIEHPRQHGPGRLPDDPMNDRRYDEADDRVGERISHPHSKRAQDNRQAGEPVSVGMVAVGYERRAVDLSANADAKYRHGLVAQKADHASDGKPAEMHHVTRVEKPVDGLIPSDQCTQQIDQDDGETSEILDPAIAIGKGLRRLPAGKHEGDPEG